MSSRPERHERIPYEPALDGIRGAAVLAVVLYHLDVVYRGKQWFGAGFLGVDAFFVLSGFLITALLLVEHREGGIGLRRFWIRRGRRLLPALFLVVGAVILYATFAARSTELHQIRADGIATLLYVTNWWFISEGTSYFDLFLVESPFQHMWSLAIEEQWYLVWPLLVLAVLRWRRGSARAVMWISIAGAALSAGWMAYIVTFTPGWVPLLDPEDPITRVYFGTDTRAQSLLVGAALSAALISGVSVRDFTARFTVPALAALVGVGMVGVWIVADDSAGWYYRGGFLAMALAVALVILAAVQPEGNFVRSLLSLRPLRWLGVISYGVYLWHWPIFVFLSRSRQFLQGWSWLEISLLRVFATLVVAAASYHLIELPIRNGALGRRTRYAPVLAPLTGAALLGILLMTTSRPPGPSFDIAQAEEEADGLPTVEALREGIDPDTRPPPSDGTTAASRVLVVGDSVAYSMAGGFTPELQREENLRVWNQTVLFCELVSGPRLENGEVVRPSNTCEGWRDSWRASAEEFAPDVAVLQVGAWEIFDREVDGDWLVFGTPEYDDLILGVLGDAVDSLGATGATVVVLTTPPFERGDTMSAREWTQNEEWRTRHINSLFEQLASDRDEVVLVDLGEWLCPDEDCIDELAGGQPVRGDGVHYTDEGAETAARWLAPQLRAIALGNASQQAGS